MNEPTKDQVVKISTPKEDTISIKDKKSSSQIAELFGIETGIVGILILIMLVVLNYFNTIPISSKFSSVFGWLPQKNRTDQNNSQSTASQNRSQSITSEKDGSQLSVEHFLIACPVSPGFCPDGKSVYNRATKSMEDLGFLNLGKGVALYSVFDGTIESKTEKIEGKNKTMIILTGENGLIATYVFQGLPRREKGATENKVKQSEIIGITDGGDLELFDFTTQKYELSLSIVNSENSQKIPVVPRTDGKALDLR